MKAVDVKEIIDDLMEKYRALSRRFDEEVDELSMNQLVKSIDALTKLGKLLLKFRESMALDEREDELTKLLSEIKDQMLATRIGDLDKRSMKCFKSAEAGLDEVASKLIDLLKEIRRDKASLLGGD